MWKVNNSKMHGLSEIGPNVPAFLIKLWKLVNSPETDELICWSESGMSFIINNPAQFSRELLSMYYKHNNMASFIRQLNMYGFHKIVTEGGGLKSDNLKNKYKDCMEFAHQCFIKDHPYLLENIKRKLPNPKSGVISNEQLNNSNLKNGTQSEILAKVLSDVNNLKGKQESWDAKLASMKRENEALWRELAIFRQKHLKQEQIINRLIHFIVTIVQPSRNVPLRRRYPLMLNDIQPIKKITKLSGADSSQFSQGSPTGPTIHEIDTTDVLFGSPEQLEVPASDVEFISTDLSSGPKFIEVDNSNIQTTTTSTNENEPVAKSSIESADNIPEDWLEIQLTEGNLIHPLTPIDPAKVNPAVAAATLKHLEGTNKKVSPISITLPPVTIATGSGKKNLTEKKVIYLTGINEADKIGKKNSKRPIVLKLDFANKKGNARSNINEASSSSADLSLDVVPKNGESSNTQPSQRVIARKTLKRKTPCPSPSPTTPKTIQTPKKIMKKAESKSCEPELEIDDLDFLLSSDKSDDELAKSREPEKTSNDSFLKLQSLYDGTISEENLEVSPPGNSDIDLDLNKEEGENFESIEDTLPSSNFEEGEKLTSDDKLEKTTKDILNFEPDSMAVVCQNSGSADSLTRDLSSHVDSVQGEIDYLKEMLKGEGYNFDPTALPWLFNDDPLSYGVLPPADEEDNEKKNEEAGVSGNELMTYGSPNLMDLVDLIGSSSSSQDWPNVLSPSPTVVTDLATPAPSPNAFAFPSPGKRRKS